MIETHWMLLAGFALSMTLAWLFIERRITTTTILAGVGWSLASLTGGNLTRITNDGTEVAVDVGVLQYVCTFLALLSFMALLLSRFGHYPPTDDDPANTDGVPSYESGTERSAD